MHARQALHQDTPQLHLLCCLNSGTQRWRVMGKMCPLCCVQLEGSCRLLGDQASPRNGGIYPPGSSVHVWGASPCLLSSCITLWVFREPARSVWIGLIHNLKKTEPRDRKVINWGKTPIPLATKWKWHLILSSQGSWWEFNEYICIWIKLLHIILIIQWTILIM